MKLLIALGQDPPYLIGKVSFPNFYLSPDHLAYADR